MLRAAAGSHEGVAGFTVKRSKEFGIFSTRLLYRMAARPIELLPTNRALDNEPTTTDQGEGNYQSNGKLLLFLFFCSSWQGNATISN